MINVAKNCKQPAWLAVLECLHFTTEQALEWLDFFCFELNPVKCNDLFALTQSPIERIFLLGFWALLGGQSGIHKTEDSLNYKLVFRRSDDSEEFALIPQFKVKASNVSYRLDFLLCCRKKDGSLRCLAIEVDGHEFHERTREQVETSNARNLVLLKLGIPSIHFSGSQIIKGSVRCCSESAAACSQLTACQDGTVAHNFAMYAFAGDTNKPEPNEVTE